MIRRLILGALAVALTLPALAADRKVATDEGETFTFRSWGADWLVGEAIKEAPPGTITIHGPDEKLWRFTLAPLPPHPSLTGDIGNLRMYVRMMARGIEQTGATVGADQKPISGAANGFYFTVHYGASKTKKQVRLQGGDYADGYTGAVSISNRPYLFEVLWNAGGESAGNTALAAVKGLSIQ
jgi:hypothetical protein